MGLGGRPMGVVGQPMGSHGWPMGISGKRGRGQAIHGLGLQCMGNPHPWAPLFCDVPNPNSSN